MAKKRESIFVCQECGYESHKWMGQCICGAWNTMTEEVLISLSTQPVKNKAHDITPKLLKDISSGETDRLDTKIGELNRVLGGGLVKGSLVLISGEPGIGKSTLILQAALNIAEEYGNVLYITGEESAEQIKIRADRVSEKSNDRLYVLAETNLTAALTAAEKIKPVFLVVDSIQTMFVEGLTQSQGSVSQVRAASAVLMEYCKKSNVPVFIVAHINKTGDLAGPKIIEHLVDCVLQFNGERDKDLRILRSFKNRFGTTSEIGGFDMGESGLLELENLSATFLEGESNSIITGVYEGTRPLLLEVQALNAPCFSGFPRRSAVGVEVVRLNMILAVLERKAGISFTNQDVYVNILGGIKPDSPAVDLAVCLAIAAGYRQSEPEKRTLAIGEIGLDGVVRGTSGIEKIVTEAARLGIERMILPEKSANKIKTSGIKSEIIPVKNIKDAINSVVWQKV